MTGPLSQELNERLPWLFQDLGFRVIYQDYSDKYMGNSVVVLESEHLRMRFVRDRSVIDVKVASLSEPEGWMELGFLWYALTGERPEPQLEGWAWFFRDHHTELAEALGPKFSQTKQDCDRCREAGGQAVARYLPKTTFAGRIRLFRTTPFGMIAMGPFGWLLAIGMALWLVFR